jgi:hypothetical protein
MVWASAKVALDRGAQHDTCVGVRARRSVEIEIQLSGRRIGCQPELLDGSAPVECTSERAMLRIVCRTGRLAAARDGTSVVAMSADAELLSNQKPCMARAPSLDQRSWAV